MYKLPKKNVIKDCSITPPPIFSLNFVLKIKSGRCIAWKVKSNRRCIEIARGDV